MLRSLLDSRLLAGAERRRLDIGPTLDEATRGDLGQFLTSPSIADFMVGMFDLHPDEGPARLLDPGSGVGSLSAAFADRWLRQTSSPLHITAVEVDPTMRVPLADTLADCAERLTVSTELVDEDFVTWAADRCNFGLGTFGTEPYDYVVMNPPYRKINKDSAVRQRLEGLGVEVSNLYAAFLTLSIRMLDEGGQLVAITPRSFANGPYFRDFRRDLFDKMSLSRIHVYDTRDTAFADAAVLQENVIFHAIKSRARGRVQVTSSVSADDDLVVVREVDHAAVVRPDDPEQFVHLAVDEVGASIAMRMGRLPCALSDTGLSVSTGRVVDFRTKPNLRMQPEPGTAPLVYPTHFEGRGVRWPQTPIKKPNALLVNAETEPLLLPNGPYVLTKRFTAKEERRRVVAVVADDVALPGPVVAFENHLNVFHVKNEPLDLATARGLATFLNSTVVDMFFRQWSGHTQVNATDLRSLRYPSRAQLTALGTSVGERDLDQAMTDALVLAHVTELAHDGEADVLMAHDRVQEAKVLLKELGMPAAQQNERSALTLLALLNLGPDQPWSDVEAPMMGITPMMDFMEARYGKKYAPNSRETIRRQTVHQFMAAGVVVQNPDDPARATNSGKNVYQIPVELLTVIQAYGTDDWDGALATWTKARPSLVERYQQVRRMTRIPVTLPDGRKIDLSAGGQNPLIRAIIEDFCELYARQGHVLYVGDTDEKWIIRETEALADLGVEVDEHGKMPDVVVYDPANGWLLLIEAVTSHGPVDPKRHEELSAQFGDCSVGLVYVTAFMDKATLAAFLHQISWETEVWIAEAPTHMIHFDGERFLGPYPSSYEA